MYTYIYISLLHTFTDIIEYIHTYYACLHASLSLYIDIFIHICIYTFYACTNVYISIYIYIHTTHIHIFNIFI